MKKDAQEISKGTASPVSGHHCPLGTLERCRFIDIPAVVTTVTAGPHPQSAVYRCTVCGHGVASPPIDDVSILYKDRESQDFQQTDGGLAVAIKRHIFASQARALLRRLDFSPTAVIDFACGSGLFTQCLADALPPSTRVAALDFFDEPPPGLGSVEYYSFTEMNALNETADLVTCFHVLEHDNDPDDVIKRLLQLLKPGGTLIIEVPNIDCRWAGLLGRYWDNWYLPYHRTHFSRRSLRGLLERHGFAISYEQPICTPSMGRTLANILERRNTLPLLLAGAALHPLQWIGEKLTQQPSSWRFTARHS